MKIIWNKVTWYSKVVAIILFVLTFYIGFILGQMKKEIAHIDESITSVNKIENNNVLSKDGKYCFYRKQIATKAEPYEVEENMVLNRKGDKVDGIKTGNQKGPDMTNGYIGNLDGGFKDGLLELVYSYSVEGSNNKELEVYKLDNNSIVKMRWPLIEKDKILIPERKDNLKQILYMEEKCSL